jgi:hypothetical protein
MNAGVGGVLGGKNTSPYRLELNVIQLPKFFHSGKFGMPALGFNDREPEKVES